MTTTVFAAAASTQTVLLFADSADTTYSAFGTGKCGGQSYSIAMTDGSAVPNYLALTGSNLSLHAPDNTYVPYIGTHNIRLTITLDDYPITHTEDFKVIIGECVPTIIPAAAPTDIVYQVGTT